MARLRGLMLKTCIVCGKRSVGNRCPDHPKPRLPRSGTYSGNARAIVAGRDTLRSLREGRKGQALGEIPRLYYRGGPSPD